MDVVREFAHSRQENAAKNHPSRSIFFREISAMRIGSKAPGRLASLLLVPTLLASAQAFAWVDTKTQAMPLTKLASTGAVAASTPMQIVVGLGLRNEAALDDFI